MENDSIVITAGLKFDASEALIIKQLGEIQDEYNSKGGMQINCKISDESLKAIQNSLGNLTQTLNVNVNAQNIQQSINQAVKSEPVKVSVEADIKKGELQKQVNAFVEKFHLTFDKGESDALKAELGEILAKYDQVKKAGNWDEMNRQWDNLTSFVENYATEIDVVSERLKEATKQSKLFISEAQKSDLLYAFGGNKGAVADYLNNVIGRFKWTYNKDKGGLSWDQYSMQLNGLIQSGLYNVNANSIDDVAKINTTHIVEGLKQLGDLLNQDKSLANEWYKTYSGDLEALRAMWEGLRQGVVDYLHEIRGEKQSLADMGWEDIGSSESTEKVRNYTQVLQEGLEKIASLKAQIKAEGGDEINSITSRFTSDAAGNVNGFILAVQKSSGEVENLFHKLVEVEDETGKVTREWQRTQITGSDSGIQKALEKASRTADTLKRQIDDLNFGAQDTSKKNAITDTGSLDRISEAYKKAETAINNLRNADAANFDRLNNEAKIEIDNLDNIIKQERNLATVRREANNEAEKQITSIQKMYEKTIDPNKPNAIKNEQSLAELKTKYEAVITAAEALKGANASTFDDLNQKLKTAIANFDVTKTQLERAENVATKLRTKDIATVKGEELANLEKFATTINNSAIPNVENLTKRIEQFRTQLKEAQDKQGLTAYLNELSVFEQEFKALDTQAKSVKKSLEELNKLGTASALKNTGGVNANIIRDSLTSLGLSTKSSDISSLKDLYNQMLGKIDKATTISDIQAIEKELGNLKSMFDETVKSTNAETEAAKQMSDALSKIDSAIGKMQNINKQLITGNLTQGEIESKKKEFQNQNLILLQEKERLATAGLLTQQIDKRIKQLGEESNEIARQLGEDKQRAEAKKEAEAIAKKEEEDAGKILAIYKEIAAQNKILANPNSTDTQKRQAVEAVDREREKLEIMTKELGTQTMLNGKRAEAMAQGERLAADAVEIAREQQQAAQAKKDETEAEKAYKKELQDVNKILKDNIVALEKFNNSAVAKNNASNPLVASQTGLNAGYIAQLQGLQESLANDKSSENVQRVKGRIEELSNTLRDARFNSEALQQSLTNASAEATLEAKIKTLTNQMNAFALNNEKAITSLKKMRSFGGETFESQWGKMMTALSAGNLDAEGLKRLTEQFRIFKTEVQGTGQLTTSFADKMASQLKMLASRWLSLYAVIGKIRTLINYVVELDTAMTKLKRVTDETAEGYERFLETAKKSARETSTTLTDTVEQAARWAKSGYDAATSAELAKTSLIYSIVGDVDNETAVSDLVTVLRGFNMEAEDSLSIVDKLDALNNKYATDAKSLGEALSVSASAMAAANNDLDQTLALITGASEITQNAKETGQAIRTITMRLRGRISCLHMGKLICI